jgi:hypothetical protein
LSGIRQPFGSIRKKANASAGMSFKMVGSTARKSAEYVLIEMSGYRAGTC